MHMRQTSKFDFLSLSQGNYDCKQRRIDLRVIIVSSDSLLKIKDFHSRY